MANEMYMLWWDEATGTAEEKIGRAANYYANKTGKHATVARVDLGMIKEEKVISGMRVIPDRKVMRNMIWLGEDPSLNPSPFGSAENATPAAQEREVTV